MRHSSNWCTRGQESIVVGMGVGNVTVTCGAWCHALWRESVTNSDPMHFQSISSLPQLRLCLILSYNNNSTYIHICTLYLELINCLNWHKHTVIVCYSVTSSQSLLSLHEMIYHLNLFARFRSTINILFCSLNGLPISSQVQVYRKQ